MNKVTTNNIYIQQLLVNQMSTLTHCNYYNPYTCTTQQPVHHVLIWHE